MFLMKNTSGTSQDSHECYFIIANIHAFTTRSEHPAEIRRDCFEIVRDYLAMGIDPNRSTIFLQTEVPAIAELTYLFAMLLPLLILRKYCIAISNLII